MNPLLWILLLPVLEIVGFIQVGDWIGAGPTIGLLVLSAVAGTLLVRRRGLATLVRAQAAASQGQAPIGAVLDGFCAVAAGILLIIPGFLTDLMGLALLVPALRRGLGRWLFARVGGSLFPTFRDAGFGGARSAGTDFGGTGTGTRPGNASDPGRPPFSPQPGIIDGDYRDVSEEPPGAREGIRRLSESQWGKHRPDGRD